MKSKKKLLVGSAVGVTTLAIAATAFAWITAGEIVTEASVDDSPPYTEVYPGTAGHGDLTPNVTENHLVIVHNTRPYDIEVTKFGTGSSRETINGTTEPAKTCPAGSVKTEAVGNASDGIPQADDPGTVEDESLGGAVIPANGQAVFSIPTTFDTLSFPTTDGEAANQDGCLGYTMTIDFSELGWKQSGT